MVNSQMDKNAFKPSKKQMYLIFRGVAFCAKRNIYYFCTLYGRQTISSQPYP